MMRAVALLAGLVMIATAPIGARAQASDPIATVQSLIAAANSGGVAAAAQPAGGLALTLPGGASWSLTPPATLPAALLPVTASGLTLDSAAGNAVDATLQFGSGPALSARFVVSGGQIVAAGLASQADQTATLLASAGAAAGGSISMTATDAAGNAASVSAKGPGSASVDASNSAGPVACSTGASALATINGSLWLCANGLTLPGS